MNNNENPFLSSNKNIYTNSIGMKLARIEPGRFTMGANSTPLPAELTESKSHFANGDFDESPAHLILNGL